LWWCLHDVPSFMRSPFPFAFDPKIERTFPWRQKKLRLEEQKLKAQETSPKIAGGGGDQWRTLRDFITPGVHDITSSIIRPIVKAYNFELKPAFISMVQQAQFGGTLIEDLNLHFSIFSEVCDTLKLNGVLTDAISLWLFPFSLGDKTWASLHSLHPESITTYDEGIEAFLTEFFPLSKTTSIRNQITTFAQRKDETFYEAWEQFKDMLQFAVIIDSKGG